MEKYASGFEGQLKVIADAKAELQNMEGLELSAFLTITQDAIADLCDEIEPLKTKLKKLESWRTDLVSTKWDIQRQIIPTQVITSKKKPKDPAPLTEEDIILYRDYSTAQLITMLGRDDALKLIKRGRHHNY